MAYSANGWSIVEEWYASESDLIIFSDAPKNEAAKKGVEETRSYIRNITGFKSCVLLSEIGILLG